MVLWLNMLWGYPGYGSPWLGKKRTGNLQRRQIYIFLIERWESSRHSLTILDIGTILIPCQTQVASEVNTKNSTNPRCGPQLGRISPSGDTSFCCNQLQLATTTRIGRIGHLLTWIAPCQHWLCREFTGSHWFTVHSDTGHSAR